jgi:hypothetical protein
VDVEPLVDRLEVLADRRARHAQMFGDLRVGQSLRDAGEHLSLPGRQGFQAHVVLCE